MWTIALFIGLVLGGVVFLVGYGRVLLFNLALRSLLVTLGSALTIVAARKATTVFIKTSTSPSPVEQPPELGEVDIEEPGGESEGESGGDVAPEEQVGEALEAEDAPSDIEDDTDIGKLADMVSETMKEEE